MARLYRVLLLLMRAEERKRAADIVAACEGLEEWYLRDVLLHVAAAQIRRIGNLMEATTVPRRITRGHLRDTRRGCPPRSQGYFLLDT